MYVKNRSLFKNYRHLLPSSKEQIDRFKNPDNDPRGPWASLPIHAKADTGRRAEQFYTITTPGGRVFDPPQGNCWRFTQPRLQEMIADNRIWFGKDGKNAPRLKKFLSEVPQGLVPTSIWLCKEVGSNGDAKLEQKELFPSVSLFDTPKPEGLISRVLHIATDPGDLVLDSFLGSGTTAAVAHKMGRRYIGIEMGEHAKTYCIPRLQKVIEGEQGGISESVHWQGGSGFTFYELGETVFDEMGTINPNVDFKTLAAYIWQKETNTPTECQFSPLLGEHQGKSIFLLYNGVLGDKRPRAGNVLNKTVLKQLLKNYSTDNEKIIYGDACFGISNEELRANKITFKQIPYDLGM